MSACDYCGSAWYRSQLVRNESGFLACPDDRKGRDEVLLDRLNNQHAQTIQGIKHPNRYDGGRNPRDQTLPIIHRVNASDITRYKS